MQYKLHKHRQSWSLATVARLLPRRSLFVVVVSIALLGRVFYHDRQRIFCHEDRCMLDRTALLSFTLNKSQQSCQTTPNRFVLEAEINYPMKRADELSEQSHHSGHLLVVHHYCAFSLRIQRKKNNSHGQIGQILLP
jgi:hypothetical protein